MGSSKGEGKVKLCFTSIRLSATIKIGDEDDRPFVVANWPDACDGREGVCV